MKGIMIFIDELTNFSCKFMKCFYSPKLILKIILVIILLAIHGYTDSVTDNRWELYDWDNILCADSFVVTACLVMMLLIMRDYYYSFKRYLSEGKV